MLQHFCKMRRILVGLGQCDTGQAGNQLSVHLRCIASVAGVRPGPPVCAVRRRCQWVQVQIPSLSRSPAPAGRTARLCHTSPALVQTRRSDHQLGRALNGRDKPFPATGAAAVGQSGAPFPATGRRSLSSNVFRGTKSRTNPKLFHTKRQILDDSFSLQHQAPNY